MNLNTHLAPHVRAFFEDHLACQRNLSPNTIQSYRDALKMFLQFAAATRKKPAAEILMTDMEDPLVPDFLSHLEKTRGNSVRTRNHRLVALRVFFEYVSSREPLLLDRCRRVLAIPLKKGAAIPSIRYLEKEEIVAIFDAVDRSSALGQRDHALLLFLYNTGARVQEASDARVSWLSLEKPHRIEILGKGRKLRVCPLWESTVRTLQKLLGERDGQIGRDDHLFLNRLGRPLSRAGIADVVEKYTTRAAAGMAALREKKVTPHTIRHTTAMHLLQSGVEVNVIRSWLGHVSLSTTNCYVQIDLAMKARALKSCEIRDRDASCRWRSKPDILAWLESL